MRFVSDFSDPKQSYQLRLHKVHKVSQDQRVILRGLRTLVLTRFNLSLAGKNNPIPSIFRKSIKNINNATKKHETRNFRELIYLKLICKLSLRSIVS